MGFGKMKKDEKVSVNKVSFAEQLNKLSDDLTVVVAKAEKLKQAVADELTFKTEQINRLMAETDTMRNTYTDTETFIEKLENLR